MPAIKFNVCPIEPNKGKTWEKLKSPRIGEKFTTMRRFDDEKYAYYESLVGKTAHVFNEKKWMGIVEVLRVEKIHASELTEEQVKEDTFKRWNIKYFNELLELYYKSSDIYLIMLHMKWVETPKAPI